MSLDILCNNLNLFCAMARDHDPQYTQFVPGFDGKTLYSTDSPWGHFLCTFNAIINRKYSSAFEKTYLLFRKHLTNAISDLKEYCSYIEKGCSGYSVKEDNLIRIRRRITNWNNATSHFLKQLQHKKNLPFHELYRKHLLPQQLKHEPEKGPLSFEGAPLDSFLAYQKLIDLEGILGQPLPLGAISNLALGKKEIENDELSRWVEIVNSQKSRIGIRLFHKAMEAICSHLERHQKVHVANVELALAERGCLIFEEHDFKHIRWRQSLSRGQILSLGDHAVAIGDSLNAAGPGRNNYIVYSLESKTRSLLIEYNRAIPGIKRITSAANAAGLIPSLEILEVEKQGRFALVEKAEPLIPHQCWKSAEKAFLAPEKERWDTLIKLIKKFMKKNRMPESLSLCDLWITPKHDIRCLRPLKAMEAEYETLENLFYEASKDNLAVFRYLMNESSLADHDHARFYQYVFENSLHTCPSCSHKNISERFQCENRKSIETSGKRFRVSEKNKKNAESFSKATEKLFIDCCRKLQQFDHINMTEELERDLRGRIIHFYRYSCAGSIIWPTIENEVLTAIRANIN